MMTVREVFDSVGKPSDTAMVVFDGSRNLVVVGIDRAFVHIEGNQVIGDVIPDDGSPPPDGYRRVVSLVAQPYVPIMRGIAARIATGAAMGSGS